MSERDMSEAAVLRRLRESWRDFIGSIEPERLPMPMAGLSERFEDLDAYTLHFESGQYSPPRAPWNWPPDEEPT